MQDVYGKGCGTVCGGLPDARLCLTGGRRKAAKAGAFPLTLPWNALRPKELTLPLEGIGLPQPAWVQCCHMRFHAISLIVLEVTRKMPVFSRVIVLVVSVTFPGNEEVVLSVKLPLPSQEKDHALLGCRLVLSFIEDTMLSGCSLFVDRENVSSQWVLCPFCQCGKTVFAESLF